MFRFEWGMDEYGIHFIRFKLHQWMTKWPWSSFWCFFGCCCVGFYFQSFIVGHLIFLFMRFCPILIMLKFKHSTISHFYNVFWILVSFSLALMHLPHFLVFGFFYSLSFFFARCNPTKCWSRQFRSPHTVHFNALLVSSTTYTHKIEKSFSNLLLRSFLISLI